MNILTINGGSSSIKFAVFAGSNRRALFSGEIERIGRSRPLLRLDHSERKIAAGDHAEAIGAVLECVRERLGDARLDAVSHRFVHGGPASSRPRLLTPAVVRKLRKYFPMDPEHLPDELAIAQAIARRYRRIPQIACFDTAFHWNLPARARLLPLPWRYQAKGLRRYGFHGLSYEYLLEELIRRRPRLNPSARIVMAHLGSGASLTAVRGRRSVDTTMALTPAAGIPMATRSGDLDPGILPYLVRTEAMTAAKFDRLATRESGLLGVSGRSGDVRDLLAREARDRRCAEALELFCYRVRKEIGAYAAALGGLDHLVFAGGIGENSPILRFRICRGLEFLGLEIDPAKNRRNAGVISARGSRVEVHVIRTDEQWILARTARRKLKAFLRQRPGPVG